MHLSNCEESELGNKNADACWWWLKFLNRNTVWVTDYLLNWCLRNWQKPYVMLCFNDICFFFYSHTHVQSMKVSKCVCQRTVMDGWKACLKSIYVMHPVEKMCGLIFVCGEKSPNVCPSSCPYTLCKGVIVCVCVCSLYPQLSVLRELANSKRQ